jgi:hypothetical protein
LNETEIKNYESSLKKLNADEQYRLWMHKRYSDFKELLIDHLGSQDTKLSKPNMLKVKMNNLTIFMRIRIFHNNFKLIIEPMFECLVRAS